MFLNLQRRIPLPRRYLPGIHRRPGRLPLLLLTMVGLMLVSLLCVDHASAQATTPTVTAAAITSSPGMDNTYALGDTITVSVTFSEAVTITGSPYVTLDIGGQPRNAAYSSAGAATGQMLFGYTVRLGDRDTDGITALANSLTLNGVPPLPEILAPAVPSTPGRECGGHGVLAGAAGQDGPTDPQYQAGQWWLGEVR